MRIRTNKPRSVGAGVAFLVGAIAGGNTTSASTDVDSFCQAVIDVEAALVTGSYADDYSGVEPTFDAVIAAAPAEIAATVGTLVELFHAEADGSPEFAVAYTELIDYVTAHCGFGELAVDGSEYAFGGLPESLDAGGYVVAFNNSGEEFHELVLLRVNDDVTLTLDELLAPADDAMPRSTPAGFTFAAPGEIGNTVVDLQPGRYLAICYLPEGSTVDNWPPSTGPSDAAPHFVHGMVHEFEVVEAP